MLCLCAHAHMYPQASPGLSLASCGPSAGFKIELPLPAALPSQFELFHSARQTLFRAHPLQLEKHLTRAGMSVSLCVTPEQCCTWEKPRAAVCRMRTAGSALLSLQRTTFERLAGWPAGPAWRERCGSLLFFPPGSRWQSQTRSNCFHGHGILRTLL